MTGPLERLRAAGFPVTEVLGTGMEGTVAALDAERAVKLWDFRDRTDVERLRVFYDAVEASGFALAVPRILEVAEVEGRMVTVQVRLHGEPLSRADAVVDVLADLAAVPVHPDMAVLPVPDGERPFDPTVPFAHSLADLVERRAPLLAGHLDPGAVEALADALRGLEPTEPRLVHGDLGSGNILAVDGRPTGCSTSATSPPSATRPSTRRWPPPWPTCSVPAPRRRRPGSTRSPGLASATRRSG